MRKITKNSINAFLSEKTCLISSTKVLVNSSTNLVRLELFGNVIAEKNIGEKSFIIRNCGFFTNTTKERLNGLPNVRINQKNFDWYLNGELWNGKDTLIQY